MIRRLHFEESIHSQAIWRVYWTNVLVFKYKLLHASSHSAVFRASEALEYGSKVFWFGLRFQFTIHNQLTSYAN